MADPAVPVWTRVGDFVQNEVSSSTMDQTGEYALLVLYLMLALGVSFLCSLLEAVLLSVPRSHTVLLEQQGRRSGRWLEQMVDQVDHPLAAILTLNTIAHTFGASGVGAQALRIWGEAWIALVGAILTLLILVFSEIIPKTLGVVHAKRLAPFAAYTIRGMMKLTWPVVRATEFVSHLIGGSGGRVITRAEVAVMADLGHEAGELEARESRMIRNLLTLDKIKVKEVMTPRSVVFMLPKDQTVAQVMEQHPALRFSRIPIYDENQDQVIGVVLRSKIQRAWGEDRLSLPLESLSQPLRAIPELATVRNALDQFTGQRQHLFLVVDEHGGTEGIITLEDAVETLLGIEIVDEEDTTTDMRKLAERRSHSSRKKLLKDLDESAKPSSDG